MTGLPAGKYRGLRCAIQLNDLDMEVKVHGRHLEGGKSFEHDFRFQADPVDLGASMLLALTGRQEASFTWMGTSGNSDAPWVMRTYWFSRDARQAAINFLSGLKENPEVDSKRLDSLINRLRRDRLFALRLDPLSEPAESGPGFVFPLSNLSISRNLAEIRRKESSSTVRLIGGLRVATNDGSVAIAAGNSGLLTLTDEQREGLGLGLRRLLESDSVMGMRMEQVSFFAPRGKGESVWDRGVRISVLGRTVSFSDVRDIARLVVLL